MIGEAEVSSYNAMSACKCTFEFLGVGVQFNAYVVRFEQLGTPSGLAEKEPFEVFHLGVEALL
jgi:hypothetical protein